MSGIESDISQPHLLKTRSEEIRVLSFDYCIENDFHSFKELFKKYVIPWLRDTIKIPNEDEGENLVYKKLLKLYKRCILNSEKLFIKNQSYYTDINKCFEDIIEQTRNNFKHLLMENKNYFQFSIGDFYYGFEENFDESFRMIFQHCKKNYDTEYIKNIHQGNHCEGENCNEKRVGKFHCSKHCRYCSHLYQNYKTNCESIDMIGKTYRQETKKTRLWGYYDVVKRCKELRQEHGKHCFRKFDYGHYHQIKILDKLEKNIIDRIEEIGVKTMSD